MNNKKVNNGVTMESRVVACTGSINFKEYPHSELPKLICELENHLLNLPFVENYYLIAHNETDTPHIHFVIEFTGQKRLKTILNDFERLGYNKKSVNVDKLGFLNATLKYFLHIDEKSIEEGKKIYPMSSIVTNMSEEFIADYIHLEDDNLNTDRLIQICLECDGNQVAIMRRLGLSVFHKWRNEILVILNYEYGLRTARENERKRRKEDDLPF